MARLSGFVRHTFVVVCFGFILCSFAQGAEPLLLRNPSLSRDKIAFLYADDIWTVAREGGEARAPDFGRFRGCGTYYSPDGTQIAYSTREHGLTDVYVVNADGGVPRRLTWEPTGELRVAVGRRMARTFCSPRRILATLTFSGYSAYMPTAPDRRAAAAAAQRRGRQLFRHDGNTLAYVPYEQWEPAWKHYRGGQTTPVWLVNIKTLDLVKIPRENSNDSSPVWEGNTVYFLSDRNGPVSLFSYDTGTKAVEQVIENHGYDLKTVAPARARWSTSSSARCISMTWRRIRSTRCRSRSTATCRRSRRIWPRFPRRNCRTSTISPTGARVVVEAHGDIFTLPAEKGDTRNLTQTPGAAERDPAWSPDGKSIAYFSDASGEYQLYIRDQDGLAAAQSHRPRARTLHFSIAPHWSPDSKHIAFSDKHLHLWYVDAAGGKPVKIDTGLRGSFGRSTELSWSPDSQWIAYTRDLENQLHAVFLYSLATHTSTQITDGMSNAAHPVFDPSGKYLYFMASTNNGPSTAGIDLSSLDRATNSSAYVVVLAQRWRLADAARERRREQEKGRRQGQERRQTRKDDQNRGAASGEKATTSQEEGRRRSPSPRSIDLAGHRQPDSLSAHPRAQLRRSCRRQDRRAFSGGRRRRGPLFGRGGRRFAHCGDLPPRSARPKRC